MPTPERTSLAAIVEAARELLETGGPSAITMQAVAARVGVRPPSLYKRVRDREALLALTAEATADDLGDRLVASGPALPDLAHAYRAFAHAHPEGFRLLFAGDGAAEHMRRAADPLLRAAQAVGGDEHALDAARLLTAWATGFVSMELAGAFRLGGDIDAAFEYGLERIIASITPSQ